MRWLWALVGFLFLTVGAVGLVLPLWPTTIFWIIAAFCLAESHPSVRDWIYARPGVGPIIQNFIEDGTISRKSKRAAIGGMMIAGAIGGWFLKDTGRYCLRCNPPGSQTRDLNWFQLKLLGDMVNKGQASPFASHRVRHTFTDLLKGTLRP